MVAVVPVGAGPGTCSCAGRCSFSPRGGTGVRPAPSGGRSPLTGLRLRSTAFGGSVMSPPHNPRQPRTREEDPRGLPGYHDPTAGFGGSTPARSALTLRAVLAGFGLLF